MCGLIGIAGDLDIKDEAVFRLMLLMSSTRGIHSTGLAAIRRANNEIVIAKSLGDPYQLFETKSFDKANNGCTSKVLIGHNRSATVGGVSLGSAHPFRFGSVVGAHNGTVRNVTALEKELGEEFKVDSQAIIAGLDKLGAKETLNKCDGAWALSWYNAADDTLNFLRNKERPLYWMRTKNKTKMYWASEVWMLQAIRDAFPAVIGDLWTDVKGYSIFLFEPDIQYFFVVPKGREELPRWTLRQKIEGAPPFVQPQYLRGYHYRGGGGGTGGSSGGNRNTGDTFQWPSPDRKKIEEVAQGSGSTTKVVGLFPDSDDDLNDPYNNAISRTKFETLAKFGCSLCQADIEYGAQGIEIFEQDEAILCKECSTGSGLITRINRRKVG